MSLAQAIELKDITKPSAAQPMRSIARSIATPSSRTIPPLREIVSGLSQPARATLRPFGRTTLDWLLEPRACGHCNDRLLVGAALYTWSQANPEARETLGLQCPSCQAEMQRWTLADIARAKRLPSS